MRKKQLHWANGSDPRAVQVLAIAREQFELDAQEALFNSDEILSATYAVLEALPPKARKRVTDASFVDIAALILLQRAQAQYQVGQVVGAAGGTN